MRERAPHVRRNSSRSSQLVPPDVYSLTHVSRAVHKTPDNWAHRPGSEDWQGCARRPRPGRLASRQVLSLQVRGVTELNALWRDRKTLYLQSVEAAWARTAGRGHRGRLFRSHRQLTQSAKNAPRGPFRRKYRAFHGGCPTPSESRCPPRLRKADRRHSARGTVTCQWQDHAPSPIG